MEKQTTYRAVTITGYCAIAVSAAIFFITGAARISSDDYFGIFVLNFLITAGFALTLASTGSVRKGRNGMPRVFQLLILFLISAYSLNRTITVFEDSVGWLGALLVAVCAAYLLALSSLRLPRFIRQLAFFLIGIGLLLWLYLAVYLVPVYPFGAACFFAFGISLHAFVPLLLIIFTVKWLLKIKAAPAGWMPGLASGAGAAVITVIIFCVQWNNLATYTSKQYSKSLIAENTDLPAWIKVSRALPDNWATERFLKGDLVYTVPSHTDDPGFFRMPSRRIDEARKHDPLVMLAALFSGYTPLSEDDRIRILESKYDARHKTEERLWNGADLRTRDVLTNATIWPSLHIAYTEKTITVSNREAINSWRRQQEEAIYTFHLPEGSVVTSLSLWINGKEAKGVLSSKGKADSAYHQIVGVEQHDPSIVQWQEGNAVSVRVFPVPAGGVRTFKIGVTSPLLLSYGRLQYQPLRFEGPLSDGAHELLQIAIAGDKPGHIAGLTSFEQDEKGRFTLEHKYDEDWQLSFDEVPVKPDAFAFDGAAYTINDYTPQRSSTNAQRIYLDLNSAWSHKEFSEICRLCKGKKLYAFTDEMLHVNDENATKIFRKLHESDFSLFPVFSIKEPENSLMITKGTRRSPNVGDLTGSSFGAQLDACTESGAHYKVFNLGGELSPFMKTLKERRVFYYEHGDIKLLGQLIRQNVFAKNSESDSSIVIEDAGIRISRAPSQNSSSSGPDHLMRLFTYNHLMHEIALKGSADGTLVDEAAKAYVVSPVSSLVVLESAADYNRFGIEDNKNSLHNATIHSNGAVPEPQEWALIIIAVGILAWGIRRRQLTQKIAGR